MHQLKEIIINRADEIADLLHSEMGIHRFEALSCEVLPTVNLLNYFAKRSPKLLRTTNLPLRLFKHRRSYTEYLPLGVVAVFGSTFSPFYAVLSDMILAFLAGNTVIFKPSKNAARIADKIQDLCDEAGLPRNIMQTVIGGHETGTALLREGVDKLFFTGDPESAETLLKKTAALGIPACFQTETTGIMIVLGDADPDFATSAFTWGRLHNAGNPGTTFSKMYVHERLHDRITELLKHKLSPSGRGASAKEISSLIKPFKSLVEVISKVNEETPGTSASVITKNFAMGAQVARQLHVSTVAINAVSFPYFLPEAPWSCFKRPVYGRRRSIAGFYEFVKTKHVTVPRSRLLVFKSPWWLPYTEFQYLTARRLLDLYRRHFTDRMKAASHLLWNFTQFLKHEKRL